MSGGWYTTGNLPGVFYYTKIRKMAKVWDVVEDIETTNMLMESGALLVASIYFRRHNKTLVA